MKNHPIDIVLIKPGNQKQLYGELSDFHLTGIEPPFWPALLAGYLRGLGFSVALIDAEVWSLDLDETARQAADQNPLVAAVYVSGTNPSASTMNMTGAGRLIQKIKELCPQTRTLLGGLHPSTLPEQTMREEKPDLLCQGEGFHTLPRLLKTLQNKTDNFAIDGLWYWVGEKIVSNPRPLPWKNLGELPMPAWDLLPMDRYRAHNWHCFDDIHRRMPYAVLYTSLGCPFQCSFCCINSLFGRHQIRYRPIEKVVEELDFLVETYQVRNIKIMDEMFALDEKRVVALCNAVIERGYNLNIWAYARVNTVTQKMLARMKQAGVNWVAYGFESGSSRVIRDVTKGYAPGQVRQVVEMTYDLDMHICANYIFGLPEDDYNSMNQTLQLMFSINAEWANIYSAMAYPGSRLYETALANNWPLPETWTGYSQYAYETLPLPTRYLSGPQVLAFRDYAFDTYYRNPAYLAMIEKKMNLETARHIREMTRTRLKRKHIAPDMD